ncbi:DASH complex subunit Ask1 [Schizosaccharomyces pombe]|uniref:DASH complex subunit ask1 n=1 Tax=Schizosaccharomyces pombe (strain 972 / ATCC 24843) TaxID=284812 RepID=ASK1_SCHPO|nr:DASH complex subunit Ask1 [Schizosaccharomyces pombe]Q9P6S5.1 RecName: Full=DASH complex subunit ask1; AltName: Full=Associated with spindles and kinetochores protein 1; AltName: Full=Meiotically up-regulated gene 181 protein; AltName: Full=Outer kinetochore protein ask1 [Schizosaccharomyces pombe 972h-]CAB89002.1 DASH complex subunit Ask1 [Schizosaccharomyces pombe]|eukprot:NP_595657.1 DASH complex subunit Ask1 [Schizosaccharomyces pombe]
MNNLEQLERLEQSITLALYEIDANFSKCHRTVTTKILPIVEKYAKNCNTIWDSSKFWKQFFEASANVSLSGVEEPVPVESNPSDQDVMSNSTEADLQLHTKNEHLEKRHSFVGKSDFPDAAVQGDNTKNEDFVQSTPKKMDVSLEDISLDDAALTPIPARMQTPLRKPENNPHTGRSALLHRVLDTNWQVQVTPREPKNLQSQEVMDIDSSPFVSPSPISMKMDMPSLNDRNSSHALSLFAEFEHESYDSINPSGMSPPKTIQFSPHTMGVGSSQQANERSLSLQRKLETLNDSNDSFVKEEDSWEL